MLSTTWMWRAGSRLDVSKHQKCEKLCTCALLSWCHDFGAQCVRPPQLMHRHARCPLIGRGFAWDTGCRHRWCDCQNDRHHHQMIPRRPGRRHWHLKVYMRVIFGHFSRSDPIFDWWVVSVRINQQTPWTQMFKRDWTTFLDTIIYSTLNSESNWEDLFVQVRNQQTCTSNNHN